MLCRSSHDKGGWILNDANLPLRVRNWPAVLFGSDLIGHSKVRWYDIRTMTLSCASVDCLRVTLRFRSQTSCACHRTDPARTFAVTEFLCAQITNVGAIVSFVGAYLEGAGAGVRSRRSLCCNVHSTTKHGFPRSAKGVSHNSGNNYT